MVVDRPGHDGFRDVARGRRRFARAPRRASPILAHMETAPLVLDIGLVLLLAAAFGWVARRFGLPAVVGYLAAGLAVSPFTPGYVADRAQIELLADVGVVLLLFEVGIEVDLGRLRREQNSLLWVSPAQILISTAVATWVLLLIGLPLFGASLVGLSVAMSSSVVVVNITRSRRRTTDRPTNRLCWAGASSRTSRGSRSRRCCLPCSAPTSVPSAGDRRARPVRGSGRRCPQAPAGRARPAAGVPRPVPDRLGRSRAGAGGGGRRVVRGADGAGGVRCRARDQRGSGGGSQPAGALFAIPDVFAVLFFVAVGSLVDPGSLQGGLPLIGLLVALVVVAGGASPGS